MSVVQSANNGGPSPQASGGSFLLPVNVTAGNSVVVFLNAVTASANIATVTTNFGGTAALVAPGSVPAAEGLEAWKITGTTGGGRQITVTTSSGSFAALAYEVTEDTFASGGQAGATSTAPSLTVNAAAQGNLILAAVRAEAAITAAPSTPWTDYNVGGWSYGLDRGAAYNDTGSVPTPPPVGSPVNTTPPHMEGGSAVGNSIVGLPGAWTGATSIATQLLSNGSAVGAANQYSSWANPYVLLSSDSAATFTCRDTASPAGATPVPSSNSILVGGGTPPPPPPPGGNVPNLPANYLANLTTPLTIQSYLGDFHDVSTGYWDTSGVGTSTPAHGSANGVCDSQAANAFMQSGGRFDGCAVIRTNQGHSVWTTMIPRGLSGNGVSGGASIGLVLPDKCIVEASIAFVAGANQDQAGGPDGTHAYPWNGPYTQARSSTSGTYTGYAEIDWLETARWSGAGGQATVSYHVATSSTSYDSSPGAVSPSPLFPVADGNFHTYTLVKGGTTGAFASSVWDAKEIVHWTMRDSFQHCVMFTGGYSNIVPSVFPQDMIVQYLRVWQLA